MKPTDAELIRAAFKARSFAYTPYSHFKVGAALLAKKTEWYIPAATSKTPATPPPTVPERTRCSRRSARGVTEFTDIAIVGSLDGKKEHPCHRSVRRLPPGSV